MLYTDIYNIIFSFLNYEELIKFWSVSKYFQKNKLIVDHICENINILKYKNKINRLIYYDRLPYTNQINILSSIPKSYYFKSINTLNKFYKLDNNNLYKINNDSILEIIALLHNYKLFCNYIKTFIDDNNQLYYKMTNLILNNDFYNNINLTQKYIAWYKYFGYNDILYQPTTFIYYPILLYYVINDNRLNNLTKDNIINKTKQIIIDASFNEYYGICCHFLQQVKNINDEYICDIHLELFNIIKQNKGLFFNGSPFYKTLKNINKMKRRNKINNIFYDIVKNDVIN